MTLRQLVIQTLFRTERRCIAKAQHDLDQRRLEGGYAYRDLVWEIKGEEEKSMARLVQLMAHATDERARSLLATELQTRYRQLERLNRLLNHRQRNP